MKKILFLVILAIALSATIDELNEDGIKDLIKKIPFKKIWDNIKKHTKKAIAFLKQIGIYDNLIELLRTVEEYYGMKYCLSKNIPEVVCTSIIEFLKSLIK